MKSFTEFMESRGHKVLAKKMSDSDSLKSFSYPTPEERREQLARQKDQEKKKTSVKEEIEDLDEESQEHEYIQQSLANKDIDSHIKDGKVIVHKDNLSRAKSHLKKIGHGDVKVIHEGFEELEEAKAPRLEGRTPAHVKKYALAMGWDHKGGGSHDKLSHPDHPLPLEIPRHKGDLPIGTLKQLQNRIELKDLHLVNHIRHKNKINDSFEIMSFKDYLNESSKETQNVIDESDEQDFEVMLEGIDTRLASHIRHLRDSGHKVVITHRDPKGNSAKFISTDTYGNRKLHTITTKGIEHKRIEDEKPVSSVEQQATKKKRGRPVGSKSGANVRV